jgi:5'-3' exonuclease
MGIPSYFAHVVRRHRAIMKKRQAFQRPIDNLYMDCNSLIYDAVRDMGEAQGANAQLVVSRLVASVCAKIRDRVASVRPSTRLMIAFDGVAPVAKLAQQRSRRYKSWFQKRVAELVEQKPSAWDTAAITPGTRFMEILGQRVREDFESARARRDPVLPPHVVVSPPDVPGEGEHKIYQFIRDHPSEHAKACTVIYGLDADLIMLTLNHLSIAPDMHLYREAPEFARSLDASLDPNAAYLLNIPMFGEALALDLRPSGAEHEHGKGMAVADYIFLCFLLGNDFLPHFPALNIRTRGIDRLMAAYTAVVAPTHRTLVSGDAVRWPVVRKLVEYLADHEHEFIREEYKIRAKQVGRVRTPQRTVDDELNAIPLRNRTDEMYIAPDHDGWQDRYYRALFGIEPDETRRQEICINYLQGLEWTLRYYTTGCPDWRWCYKYDYPPLLQDLVRYVPALGTRLLEMRPPDPVVAFVQLAYVLPAPSLHLLPASLRDVLMLRHPEWYEPDCELRTAFCKYLWEAHPQLVPIDLRVLDALVTDWQRAAPPTLA